jgi:hypothetical protein
MRKPYLLTVMVVFSVYFHAIAQIQQYMPLEIRQAYQKATRSLDGTPGPKYWQNHADYNIRAELLTDESKLSGEESIVYFNNSPDTLSKIVLRLYPDLFKKGNARNWPLGEQAVNDGTQINWLEINGKAIDLKDREVVYRSATNLHVNLPDSLLPGDSINIQTSWEFEVPTRTVRMGNYKNNRFFIAYWYPQVAVYDDIDGWDVIEYHGTVEYYNDFNNYQVDITVPEGFVVWATGDLMNEEKCFSDYVLERLKQVRSSEEVLRIFSTEDCRNNKVLRNSGKNTWSFSASEVPDFSFAAADEMNWDGASPIADPATGRRVLADAVYPDSTRSFHNGGMYSRQTVEHFSRVMPGYPFPYSHMTSFCNGRRGGGMETPMMANNGDPGLESRALGLFGHENAHTYFPFLTGINERKYAWMDEGWAVFLPTTLMEKEFPDYRYFERTVSTFEEMSGKEKESALMVLSYQIAGYSSYRYHAYSRSAMAYYFLQDALGDSVFQSALLGFIDRWKGKHPTPYDFFNTFVNLSGQRLFWFIEPWFYSRAYADQGIRKVTMDNMIVVENVGGLPLPVSLLCEYEDGSEEIIAENTSVWQYGDAAIVLAADPEKKIKKLTLGSNLIPDINMNNNILEPVYE